MDAALGASRGELLEWINSTLHMGLTKIEETASGAVACQILDMLFSDSIPMQRVNFSAKDPYEYTKNYKILQTAFQKHHIEKNVDVGRLMKGRPQDNLEFMQWLKRFFDQYYSGTEYNAEERRSMSKGGKAKRTRAATSGSPTLIHSKQAMSGMRRSTTLENEMTELKRLLDEKDGEIMKMSLEAENLIAERDFYNLKLVAIDELLLKSKNKEGVTAVGLISEINTIL